MLPYDLDYDKYALKLMKCTVQLHIERFNNKNRQNLQGKKNEKSIADFNDLEHFALNILRNQNEKGI